MRRLIGMLAAVATVGGSASALAHSRLASVRQYGRNATVDAAGNVTAGSSLPAPTFGYADSALSYSTAATGPVRAVRSADDEAELDLARVMTGDFNGDGKTDLAAIEGWGATAPMSIYLSSGDGTFSAALAGPSRAIGGTVEAAAIDLSRIRVGDFDGDGKTDLAFVEGYGSTAAISIHRSLGDGTFAAPTSGPSRTIGATPDAARLDISRVRTGDFNGDGRTDFYAIEGFGDSRAIQIHLSLGTGAFAPAVLGPIRTIAGSYGEAPLDLARVLTGDFDGDGNTDFLTIEGMGAATPLRIYLSAGDGTFHAAVNGPAFTVSSDPTRQWIDISRIRTGDLNADGKTDLVVVNGWGTQQPMSVFMSNGGEGFLAAVSGPLRRVFGSPLIGGIDLSRVQIADMNGDGRDDVFALEGWGTTSTASVYYSRSDLTFGGRVPGITRTIGATAESAGRDIARVQVGDWNGDGRMDCAAVEGLGGSQAMTIYLAQGARPGLLTQVDNGIGGSATIEYKPSSAWPNTNNPSIQPTATAVTTNDGRGGTSTVRYEFSGGLVDRLGRRFLGYRYVKSVVPCLPGETSCPYAEAWYHQDYGMVSKPEEIRSYDETGRLLSAEIMEYSFNTSAPFYALQSGKWAYEYDSDGVTYQRTYATSSYDEWGNVALETGYGDYTAPYDDRTVRYQYRPNETAFIVGKPAAVDSFSGTSTAGTLLGQILYTYDGAATWDTPPTVGLPTRTDNWDPTCNCFKTTTQTVDAFGNVASETEAGLTTSTTYDPVHHRFPISSIDVLGRTQSVEFDVLCGAPTALTDAQGRTTRSTYDTFCRNDTTTDIAGNVVTFAEYNVGDPANQYRETRHGDLWTREYYDGLGRVYRSEKRGLTQPIRVDSEWDARNQLARQSLPYTPGGAVLWAQYTYDARGRTTRVTRPDGRFEAISYGLGTKLAVDVMGHEVMDVFDAAGRLLEHKERHEGAWETQTYSYSNDGYSWAELRDALGNVYRSERDANGKLLRVVDPDLGTRSYDYDIYGRMIAAVNNAGERTTYTHDEIGRLLTRTTREGTTDQQTTEYRYDEARPGFYNLGMMTSIITPTKTSVFNYDYNGRLARQTTAVDGVVYPRAFHYDDGGRLVWLEYADGDTLGTAADPLQYDDLGRLRSIPEFVSNIAYDDDDQVAQIDYANGTSTTFERALTRKDLVTRLRTNSGATVLQDEAYAYDDEGKLTAQTSAAADESWTYGYDDRHQLVSATNVTAPSLSQTMAYDAIGRVTSNSRLGGYGYAAAGPGAVRPHAVLTAGANTYSYDENGNMVAGAGRSITWNGDGMPETVNGATFVYDGDGSRLKKTVDGVTTLYLGDLEITGCEVTKYVSLTGGQVVAKKVGETRYWMHPDGRGSVNVITDESGAQVGRKSYRPWGEIQGTSGVQDEFGYTGQRADTETGLVFLNARYYDPVLARFISPDPTTPGPNNISLDRYAYASNDPINQTDTDGFGFFSFMKKVGNFFKKAWGTIKNVISIAGWFFPPLKIVSLVIAVVELGVAAARGQWRSALVGAAFMLASMKGPLARLNAKVDSISSLAHGTAKALAKAAVGFGTGFASGLASGATVKQALKGGIMSAGMAAAEQMVTNWQAQTSWKHANAPSKNMINTCEAGETTCGVLTMEATRRETDPFGNTKMETRTVEYGKWVDHGDRVEIFVSGVGYVVEGMDIPFNSKLFQAYQAHVTADIGMLMTKVVGQRPVLLTGHSAGTYAVTQAILRLGLQNNPQVSVRLVAPLVWAMSDLEGMKFGGHITLLTNFKDHVPLIWDGGYFKLTAGLTGKHVRWARNPAIEWHRMNFNAPGPMNHSFKYYMSCAYANKCSW